MACISFRPVTCCVRTGWRAQSSGKSRSHTWTVAISFPTTSLLRSLRKSSNVSPDALFDGFPRTVPQAEALDGLLHRKNRPYTVILFDVERAHDSRTADRSLGEPARRGTSSTNVLARRPTARSMPTARRSSSARMISPRRSCTAWTSITSRPSRSSLTTATLVGAVQSKSTQRNRSGMFQKKSPTRLDSRTWQLRNDYDQVGT